MNKHTPGPWRTYNMSKNKILKQWHIQRDDCKHDIALVSLDVAADERESVANLIAAAPAMYEALVETMRVLRSLRDNKEEWYTLVTPELLTAWDKNKAALAQAEGTNR